MAMVTYVRNPILRVRLRLQAQNFLYNNAVDCTGV